MKKTLFVQIILVLLLAGLMMLLLYEKEIRMDVTEAEVESCLSDFVESTSVEKAQNMRMRRNLQLEKDDYDLVVYYLPKETMDVSEVLIVRGDTNSIRLAKSLVEERIKSQLAAFTGYGEHQTELLNNAKIEEIGNYLIYVVADDAEELTTKIKNLLEVSK